METNTEKDNYTHILKYTGIFGGVQGLGILVGIVRNKLVAVILGPSGMGLISLFNSTINLVSNGTNFGISFSAIKNLSEIFDTGDKIQISRVVKTIRLWSLIAAVIGMLVCIFFSDLLSQFTFKWGDHTLHFILLSPVIGMMAVTGGEMAILKGMRQLMSLALIPIFTVISALIISVPIYLTFGETGIVPALVLMTLASMLITMKWSLKAMPYRLSFSMKYIHRGNDMIKLGLAFVLAGIMGSGAEFLIRSYLNNAASLYTVGLYNAGYMMTMTYAGMVFSAMETDFFPRLSAHNSDNAMTTHTVNQQIEVTMLLISPILTGFIIFLPILLPLLYSGKFLPAIGMMNITALAMYLRAVKLPVAYINLAKGASKAYLLLESLYDIFVVLAVIAGYSMWGLTGTGIALMSASLFDFIIVSLYAHFKYSFRFSCDVIKYSLCQIPFGVAAYLMTFTERSIAYWVVGSILCLISTAISVKIIHGKTSLWNKLGEKLTRKFKK